ncbi:acyltransferase family protein [Saccharophagus degradans]|uniref:Acyltransferase n=1 Tax=Saccharophagus degradans TaxID=86304 RepID=A0AAW7X237_9GAMM|nr:acyltransferase [Saccharophagus degradans]MDO6421559.1 acyltransferase [Saccharophagus degradans]MDO6608521.1 acyltransferase [Saccharophagus degradans]
MVQSRAGQYGVMLFFMLSGFLMSYLYIGKSFDKSNIMSYVTARIGKVVPLYLVIVFSSYLLLSAGVKGVYEISDIHELISHVFFIYGESVLWSIAPEMHFYFLFVGLWLLAIWRPAFIYVLIAIVLSILYFSNFPRPHGSFLGLPYDFHVFRSLPYFLVGVALGMNYKSLKLPVYLKSNWFVAALLLIPLMYPEISPVNSSARMKMWLSYEVLFVMSFVFFSVVFLVPDSNILLANKVGDFLGRVSYSLYLLHMPIIVQLNKVEMAIEHKLVCFIVFSLMAAYLSERFIERPAIKLIRRRSPSN